MKSLLHSLLVSEDGQDLMEYALLAALLSIVSVIALNELGPTISDTFSEIRNKFSKFGGA